MARGARPRPRRLAWRPRRLEKSFDAWRVRAWFAGKDFSADWTSGHFSAWRRMLAPWRREPLRILEIGAWEGRSALFFLNFFPNATIVCVDTFAGGADQHAAAWDTTQIESRFDRNLAAFAGRVEKHKARSADALARLEAEGRRFDLAYIDGSHRRDDVAADSAGVWRLMDAGGVVIWDDYDFGRDFPAEERPGPAIDDFLRAHYGHYRLLAKDYQVAVERL